MKPVREERRPPGLAFFGSGSAPTPVMRFQLVRPQAQQNTMRRNPATLITMLIGMVLRIGPVITTAVQDEADPAFQILRL